MIAAGLGVDAPPETAATTIGGDAYVCKKAFLLLTSTR